VKKSAALVGFLSACIALFVGAQNLVINSGGPNTSVDTDEHLKMVKGDGEQFAFQLPLTLMNACSKPDTIYRPHARLQSDLGAITYSDEDVVFLDKQGNELDFPLILQKNAPVQLTCTIRWRPAGDYYKWMCEQRDDDNRPALIGRIELTGIGRQHRGIKKQFGLLAADTIRELKPGGSRTIHYLYTDGERPIAGNAGSPTAASQESGSIAGVYSGMGIRPGNIPPLASLGFWLAATVDSHYATPGEIASGKEVPGANASEVAVNVRPCGGQEELVIFRQPYKKRVMGKLPCGVTMVQVEKQ